MKNNRSLSLLSPLIEVKGVGPKSILQYEEKEILTVGDLLMQFPGKYIDFSKVSDEIETMSAVYRVKISTISESGHYRRRNRVIKAVALHKSERIVLYFFNNPYIKTRLQPKEDVLIYGRVTRYKNELTISNPIVNTPSDLSILTVYKKIGSIKSGNIKKTILEILKNISPPMEPLPKALLAKNQLEDIETAFRKIHLPDRGDIDAIEHCKKRFKYMEFLNFQLELQLIRNTLSKRKRIFHYTFTAEAEEKTLASIPFTLSPSQQHVLDEIKERLRAPDALSGLIQGDVGSGKTIVSFIILYYAILNGFQGAILVPTEILAKQHYSNAKAYFNDASIELLTGSTPIKEANDIKCRLKSGKIDLLIGTHAMLNEKIIFKRLAMLIIDEQHRFGVSQRASMFLNNRDIDLLVMTATPIPRTLLLSMYSDIELFIIKKKPGIRIPTKTKIISVQNRTKFYKWMKSIVDKGEKVYIILPLIENSDFFETLRSIEEEKSFFSKTFHPNKIGIITGKTDSAKRNAALNKLKEGKLRIVVATTVIEVGIDVSDVNHIVIENADRYGLAQLHQLRGRVGRGKDPSYCYLIPSTQLNENGKERLKAVVSENNGFAIAEKDFEMRGGGVIAGLNQTGRVGFRVGDVTKDFELFEQAKLDAQSILDGDIPPTADIQSYIKEIEKKMETISFS